MTPEVTGSTPNPSPGETPQTVTTLEPTSPKPPPPPTAETLPPAQTTTSSTSPASTTTPEAPTESTAQAAPAQSSTPEAQVTPPAENQTAPVASATTTPAQPASAVPPTQPAANPTPAPVAKAIYFLQLAAFANEKQARDLAASLSTQYPTSVTQPESEGVQVYRVLVGPLNKAESGTLLYWFRRRGYPDAFLKVAQ